MPKQIPAAIPKPSPKVSIVYVRNLKSSLNTKTWSRLNGILSFSQTTRRACTPKYLQSIKLNSLKFWVLKKYRKYRLLIMHLRCGLDCTYNSHLHFSCRVLSMFLLYSSLPNRIKIFWLVRLSLFFIYLSNNLAF